MGRFKTVLAVYAFIEKDNKILLQRRANTGYLDGQLVVPAGHVDGEEHVTEALQREMLEELGIDVATSDINFRGISHRYYKTATENNEIIDCWFSFSKWKNEPTNKELNKCSELVWVDKNNLPDDVSDLVRDALMSEKFGLLDTHMHDRVRATDSQ